MNALEVAQYQSEDFMSYLEYVAKQDYSKVAPDVLEQKKKLFPIMQRLFELQKQYDALPHHASECVQCGACETRCPFEVPIRERMLEAAKIFGK